MNLLKLFPLTSSIFFAFLLLFVIVIQLTFDPALAKCLINRPDVTMRRHFYYNGTSLPIRIETSDRPSHQLVSRMLRTLLIEVLGYADVQLDGGYNDLNATDILHRLSSIRSGVPETMVNMEVWIPTGYNMELWMTNGQLVNGGPLGPFGRFGWFIPSFVSDEKWTNSQILVDHWKSLRLNEISSLFALDKRSSSSSSSSSSSFSSSSSSSANLLPLLHEYLTRKTPGSDETFCDDFYDGGCHGGVLIQPKCRHHNKSDSSGLGGGRRRCAILLSSYPELDGGLLFDQIRNLDLLVNIAWIGRHLNGFVEDLTSRDHSVPVLFFNWVPNDLTASGNYSRVHFPVCRTSNERPVNCDFEVHQLTKMMWATMKSHTPEAYHLISQVGFSQDEYDELLRDFSKRNAQLNVTLDDALQSTVCHWLQTNEDVWSKWIPDNIDSRVPIYIGGLFPLTGPYWRQPAIVEGAKMAVELVNNDASILPDYELILLIQDTQCKVDVAMKHFVQYMSNKTHPIAGILGPGCSETAEPIAGVSKHFNTIVISYSAEALQLTNRAMFPLFFRTVPNIMQNSIVYGDLFRRWNWQQVALLAEDGQNFPEYHAFLKDFFFTHSIQVPFDRKMPRQTSPAEASKYMDELKRKEVKIVIMTSFEQAARAVICEAYKKDMTSYHGYVWFLPAWFTKEWWQTDRRNRHRPSFGEIIPCTSREMERAVAGHFFFNTAFLGPEASLIVGNLTVKDWAGSYLDRLDAVEVDFSPYGSYAYDAVMVLALGLNRLLSSDPTALESLHTDRTVQKFMHFLNDTRFTGASGPVQFAGADRTGIININQRIDRNSSSFTQLIGQFYPDKNASDRLSVNDSFVWWPTGSLPSDGTPLPKMCSIESIRLLLNVDCDMAVIIVNIIGISLFVIIMLISLIVVKKRYDRKVRVTRARMEELGLLPPDTSWLCLDQWEVPRDHVVLNRKLGEGAFGTVYGGEALINESWVAVAVKTLKIGSNPEEKLDFLSEAEMMKRFEHKNIVRLLGVCTRGEPAYTIMEFMLHGDLKTFLLSRRQLVGQLNKEAEDISCQALTQMALDVALGLQYLASLKYVHRDLACRNCLVHAGKAVKIGDFGMTRPMYDSDYYRFNKRGMFPVRWMAPESLSDGLFATPSDIWSYGVLLYEIMTFGSFPYQGLSNRQVLNYVKNGSTIVLPAGCPPKVQMLMQTCWTFDAKDRPSIDYIIDVLEQSPGLIVPCLDAPSTSVAIEGPGSLNMNLLPRVRHRNQYQKNPGGGERIVRRGLSLSSHDGDGKLSGGEQSPGAAILPSDPFDLVTGKGAQQQQQRNQRSVVISDASASGDETQNNGSVVNTKATAAAALVRLSGFDSFARLSVLSRSISADERLGACSRSRGGRSLAPSPPTSAGGAVGGTTATVTGIGAGAAPIFSNDQDRFATEPRHATAAAAARSRTNDAVPPPALTLESRADSDYCSQHSKDFPNVGCVPFVS